MRSSASTFPILASARPDAAWWSRVWPAHGKAAERPLAGPRDVLARIFRPETPGRPYQEPDLILHAVLSLLLPDQLPPS